MGTINMLGLAKRVKARILLASTSEIYGDPTVHPQPESYWGNVNTIGIRVSLLFSIIYIGFCCCFRDIAQYCRISQRISQALI
jgi:nucleoside-diphosphate-sugar epimerase